MIKCPECRRENSDETKLCACGYTLTELREHKINSQPASHKEEPIRGEEAISMLRIFAWLDFVVGIIGAIVVLNKFGSSGEYILIGLASVLQGVFCCAFFLVVASIAENLIAIRKKLTPNQQSN